MREGYTNISVGHEVRTEVVQFQLQAQGALGQRIKQGDAIRVALAIASGQDAETLRAAAVAVGLIPPAESNGETQ
jgi:hypothetical protein